MILGPCSSASVALPEKSQESRQGWGGRFGGVFPERMLGPRMADLINGMLH